MGHGIRGNKAFASNLIIFIFLYLLRIICSMYRSIDTLKADSVEEVLKQCWLTKAFSAD